MLQSFLEGRRARRIVKKGWRLQRAGDASALAQLALEHRETHAHAALKALLARCMAEDDDRDAALKAFGELRVSLKGNQDRDGRYLRLFALYNLALIRNSIPDAAHCARQGRQVKVAGWLRTYLPMPLLAVRPEPPPALTSMI